MNIDSEMSDSELAIDKKAPKIYHEFIMPRIHVCVRLCVRVSIFTEDLLSFAHFYSTRNHQFSFYHSIQSTISCAIETDVPNNPGKQQLMSLNVDWIGNC